MDSKKNLDGYPGNIKEATIYPSNDLNSNENSFEKERTIIDDLALTN